MLLRPNPVRTDRFTWVPASKTFVAEASDLGVALARVYDDACDVGLTLVSHVTGTEVVCAVHHEIRDGEGELVATVLMPVGPRSPLTFTVHVLND